MGELRKHPEAKCEECPLRQGGKFVPSKGAGTAELAFVGESPAIADVRRGEPFAGPSGLLLDRILEEYRIDKEKVFFSNATLCRPPDGAAPPKSAIAACRPRLVHELESRSARTVVALGNSAAESLLGTGGVTKLRIGPGKPASYNPDVRVISTLQPAAALRQGDLFPSIVADIGKAVLPSTPWEDPCYVVVDTEESALAILDELLGRTDLEEVTVDIEVDVEKDTGFDHPNHYGMLCVGIGYSNDAAFVVGEQACKSEAVVAKLRDVLRAKKIIAQNGKFDLAGLYPLVGALDLYFDTMLAHYVLDERTAGIHGLKTMAQEYLGAPPYDNDIKKYVGPKDGYGVIPRDILYKYNAYDAVCTFRLKQLFELQLEEQELRHVHDFLVRASNQLMYLELNGIAVDREYLKELDTYYVGSIVSIEDELEKVTGERINPRSPMQVKKWLASKGVEVDSTNEDTLNELLIHPKVPEICKTFAEILLRHRKESKAHGTYVKGIRKRLYRGRVYPTFLLHGTTSGRLSCRNPNLQNIPRDKRLRRLFVPAKPTENVFVHTDYSQAELRVLSYLAGDKYFRDIFNTGRDLFDELTPVLYPHADKNKMDPVAWKELRIRVKAYVYGLAYGRSEYSIAGEFKISTADAKRGMDAFFEVIPDIVEFRERTRTAVLSGKDLITPFGRHRRYWLITEENKSNIMNEALAFLPQSTASDMTLTALTNLRPKLRGIGFIRNIIHDAMIVECRKEDAEMVAAMMNEEMVNSAKNIVGDYVQFATDSTYGPSWGDV